MNADTHARRQAARLSYLGAALFVGLFLAFGLQLPVTVVGLLGVAAHVVLLPVVAAVPAPAWARAAAYGWLVIDTALNVMGINLGGTDLAAVDQGAVRAIVDAMRLGIHVSAALWIAAAGWRASGVVRPTGLVLAMTLGGYSLVAPWVPVGVYFAAFVLLPVWLGLLGRYLAGPAATREPQAIAELATS